MWSVGWLLEQPVYLHRTYLILVILDHQLLSWCMWLIDALSALKLYLPLLFVYVVSWLAVRAS